MKVRSIKTLVVFTLICLLVLPTSTFAASTSLKLGLPNQKVEDITVNETIKGAFKEKLPIYFTLPSGVTFATLPEVEVVSGDLKIDSVINDFSSAGREYIKVTIKSESSTPSTISMRDIRLTISRKVPDGPLYLDLSGEAINQSGSLFDDVDKVISKISLGEVIDSPTDISVVFKVGSQLYNYNGVSKAMDVVPYVKDNRTFVPIRYLVSSLGVDDQDILFDNDKVTINKGSQSIVLTIGSNQMITNGTTVIMDIAPEYQNGRVMLPVRAVAEALQAQVNFIDDQVIITNTL
ncbi:copper amine oxidase N-terminal domain-containing protein [Desulforamulus aeronauticus]|uniref:Copper amine oxidase N-terminal domain-containing protein n=1 Tax=Desulforamulus aeronauticus DSM 10349 TaxID=1121421 RepID=A0A1M6PW28_9FIRM|nr:copper amine oxidase N-terminal domain-containing protein [Desulforamulus aeronauticus]SHK12087.1 Copper amine oxidase N-terminal domain-containing protein [Desulforamulus aeronauticus DSM 10349]